MTDQSIPVVPGDMPKPRHVPGPPPWQAPPAKAKRGVPAWVGIVLVLLAGGAIWGGLPLLYDGTPAKDDPTSADVVVDSCYRTVGGDPAVKLRITNSTSRARDYSVTVAFNDSSGQQLATATAHAADVQPGQTAITDARAFSGSDYSRCVVTSVRRS